MARFSPDFIVEPPQLGLVARRLFPPHSADVLQRKARAFGRFIEAPSDAKQGQRRPLVDGERSSRGGHSGPQLGARNHDTTQSQVGVAVKSFALDAVLFAAVLLGLYSWLALGFWFFGLNDIPEFL